MDDSLGPTAEQVSNEQAARTAEGDDTMTAAQNATLVKLSDADKTVADPEEDIRHRKVRDVGSGIRLPGLSLLLTSRWAWRADVTRHGRKKPVL